MLSTTKYTIAKNRTKRAHHNFLFFEFCTWATLFGGVGYLFILSLLDALNKSC